METQFFRMQTADKRLGRNVKHDPRSVQFPYRSSAFVVQSVQHKPLCRVFDQGRIGSCTGNAALTAISCEPFVRAIGAQRAKTFVENDAVDLYADATRLDDFQGDFPPNDTGSDGLSVAKVLRARGWISGYRHVLSGATGIALALQEGPVTLGINWYDSFYSPKPNGDVEITRTASVVGGHQVCVTGYDSEPDVYTFRNSWGPNWGASGYGRFSGATLDRLMGEDGDATVFVPASEPAPEPIEDPALARLLGKLDPWLKRRLAALGANSARDEIRRYLSHIGAL